jgi:sulfur-oxidizing protein SoxY
MPDAGSARRRLLQGAAAVAVLHAVRLRAAEPDETARLAAAVRAAFGDTPITPGRVTIETPPLTRIDLFAPRNNVVPITEFHLGPRNGVAVVSTRIRLSASQQLLAIARTNDGRLWSGAATVEVTTMGCG